MGANKILAIKNIFNKGIALNLGAFFFSLRNISLRHSLYILLFWTVSGLPWFFNAIFISTISTTTIAATIIIQGSVIM